MSNVGQTPLYLLQEEIRLATGELVDRVQQATNGVMVVCADSRMQKKVLDLHGWSLEGHVVKTSRMECSLSGDEICEFITERLQTEAKLQGLQSTVLGGQIRSVAEVKQQGQFDQKPQSPRSPGQKGGKPAFQERRISPRRPGGQQGMSRGRNSVKGGKSCEG